MTDSVASDRAPDTVADGGRIPPEMLDVVVEPQDLTPAEKETTIRWGKRDDHARIHTDELGVTRRLLAHPETVVLAVHVDDDGRTRTVSPREWGGRRVVGVEATLPVAALGVKRSRRANPQHCEVITDSVLQAGRNARLPGDGGGDA